MKRRILVAFGFLPFVLYCCRPQESHSSSLDTAQDSEPLAVVSSESSLIKITCVPTGGIRHQYRGSVAGPGGELADGDEYIPYMVLKDGTQEIVITNVIYDVLVKQAGLDPLKEYTFDITKDESTTSYRIARIMDGKAVKYETPVLGHPTKQ